MYSKEFTLQQEGYRFIAGVDEAGRGPLAGPVVAAAVILPENEIPGIRDSKKLSEKKREQLFQELLLLATVGVGIIPWKIIDRINILEATKLAMEIAVEDLVQKPDFILVDGKNMFFGAGAPQESIINGDSTSASIAAASIIAKVTRDRLMVRYHQMYPEYEFHIHKGYPTRVHLEKLDAFGPSSIHRKSFAPVKKFYAQS